MRRRMTFLQTLSVMGLMAHGIGPNKRRSWIDDIDIESEYHLIKEKKSNLSKRQRDIVIAKYEQLKSTGELN